MNHVVTRFGAPGILGILLLAAIAAAEPVVWHGQTLDGQSIDIPSKQTTLALFLRPGQKQSAAAQRYLKPLIDGADDLRVIAFVSGPDAAMRAAAHDNASIPWPVVADPLFEASGSMHVHVWPTTLIIAPDGNVTAHVPGLSSSYLKDVEAHLDFARGRITPEQRDQRLASNDIITDSAAQIAARHVKVAQQMMDRRKFALAKAELDTLLKMNPTDPHINLDIADLLSRLGEPQQALDRLEGVAANIAPPWRMALIRGRSLVRLQRYDDAATTLGQAVQLNPKPAEGWYLLGITRQMQQQSQQAAEAFRKAYETTEEGRSHVMQ